jgi:hypothetical protein
MVLFYSSSSGAIIHLSRYLRAHHLTCSSLLHLKLRRLQGQATRASTVGALGTSLETVMSCGKATRPEPQLHLGAIRSSISIILP